MNIHEYQAKELLAGFGVQIPRGGLAYSPEQAAYRAREIGGNIWVVKAQIHSGGRGKAGGVIVCHSENEVHDAADRLFGRRLVTEQTGAAGKVVYRVYVEGGVSIANELYLGLVLDRKSERVMVVASSAENNGTATVPATEAATASETTETTEPAVTEPAMTQSATVENGVVDITDQVLVSTDANCAAYVGSYSSMITDVSTGTEFDGSFTVSESGDTCTFVSNQIPNHDAGEGSRFATDIAEVNLAVEVTTNPVVADGTTALDMGASVIMLNGVKWEAYPAACFGVGNEPEGQEAIGCGPDEIENPWRYNIGSPLNNFGFDDYLAHVQPGGLYHYHSTPSVLYDIECEGTAVSPVIGFAADGFPLYGPCFEDADGSIRAAETGYTIKDGVREDVDGYTTPSVVGNVTSDEYDGQFIGDHEWTDAGDLDGCNGMTVDGQYGYYVTGAYPYVLACYAGTVSNNFR